MPDENLAPTNTLAPAGTSSPFFAIVAAGVPSALSYSALDWRAAGRPVLDWLDRTVGGTGVIVAALATALVISWTRPVRQIGAPFGLTGRPAEAAESFRRAFGLVDGGDDMVRDNLRRALAKRDDAFYAEPRETGEFQLVRRGASEFAVLTAL